LDPQDNTAEQTEGQPEQPESSAAAAASTDPLLNEPPDGPEGMDEACRREISVEIPLEVVNKEQDNLVSAYSKQARVPGFRKGKVPASMVRNRFSSQINNDVLESLVPQYFREAVTKAGFRPVSQPFIYGLENEPGQPIRFKAAFEVFPEFELSDYKDIKVEKPEIKIGDEAVEHELKHLQERQASFDPVEGDRGAEDGEFAQVSFTAVPQEEAKAEAAEAPQSEATNAPQAHATDAPQGEASTEGKPENEQQPSAAQPVQMNEVLVEIGGANTLPEFSESLRGVKAGEERDFLVHYPAEFHDPRLAGKVFSYKVKVDAVKKKTLPEVNDDFARELNQEFQTLDQLKQRMRENMETQQSVQAEQQAKEQLIEKLLEKHEFTVPRAMVEHQIDVRLERGLRALAAQGMRTEDMKRMDFRRLRAGQREAAIKEVRSRLLLERIAAVENIEVGDEELEREIAALAQQMKQSPAEVRQRLVKEGALERIRTRMRSEKALDLLYSNS
jgi:trigger factor